MKVSVTFEVTEDGRQLSLDENDRVVLTDECAGTVDVRGINARKFLIAQLPGKLRDAMRATVWPYNAENIEVSIQ